MKTRINDLRVFVFPGGFGLPTLGPFALKLETWLRMMNIDYQRVIEPRPEKGPKGKNPWIEYGSVRMGDTELIIEHIEEIIGRGLDDWHSPEQSAIALAVRRMIEEHLHQILEYELIVMDEGWKYVEANLPPIPVVRQLIGWNMRTHFRKQLFARGIARHQPEVIAAKGRADIDALSELLGDKVWLMDDKASTVDASMYGMVAPMIFSPIEAPVMQYARSKENIVTFCKRVQSEFFSDFS